MMHESRRSVDKRRSRRSRCFAPKTSDAVDARIPPTVLSAGTGVEAVCAQIPSAVSTVRKRACGYGCCTMVRLYRGRWQFDPRWKMYTCTFLKGSRRYEV